MKLFQVRSMINIQKNCKNGIILNRQKVFYQHNKIKQITNLLQNEELVYTHSLKLKGKSEVMKIFDLQL